METSPPSREVWSALYDKPERIETEPESTLLVPPDISMDPTREEEDEEDEPVEMRTSPDSPPVVDDESPVRNVMDPDLEDSSWTIVVSISIDPLDPDDDDPPRMTTEPP